MFLLPLYGVVLAAMYFGGLLLLVTVLPFAFIAAVSCLLIWLVLVKRYAGPWSDTVATPCLPDIH